MDRSGLQRIFPIALIVIVIVIAIAALVSLGQSIFGGGSGEPEQEQVNVGKEALTETQSTSSIRMSVRGPIVASENFHSYDITISPEKRNMTTYVGYVGKQVGTKNYSNNRQAYEQLVFALDRAGMMDGTPLEGDANDLRGICATGLIYQFEVLSSSTSVQSLWTTSCKSISGSLTASRSSLTNLFQDQIPDFNTLSRKISLY